MRQAQSTGEDTFDDDFQAVLIKILIAQVLCSASSRVLMQASLTSNYGA
jgi:hypothetical protein